MHFAAKLGRRPCAILVVSAHWEETEPSVTANPKPSLVYDYTNFPPHTYALRYDVSGSPELSVARTRMLTRARHYFASGLAAWARSRYLRTVSVDVSAGGYTALAVVFCKRATIRRVHLQIGEALAPLRNEGVLIVGSGMSFHNLERIFDGGRERAVHFDAWLTAAVTGDPVRRAQLITRWTSAPAAREAHLEADHLAPLFVAAGAPST